MSGKFLLVRRVSEIDCPPQKRNTDSEIVKVNLTQLALSSAASDDEERLQQGVYPSPGGCDEFMPIFLCQKRIPREQMKEWQGKLTGLRDHGEKITLALCPLDEVWRFAGRDAKVLAGWALYTGLRKEGKL